MNDNLATCPNCEGRGDVPHKWNDDLRSPCTRCAGSKVVFVGEVVLTPFRPFPEDTPKVAPSTYAARLFARVRKEYDADLSWGRHRHRGQPVGLHRWNPWRTEDEEFESWEYPGRFLHLWSPLAWSVKCPEKNCLAEVDQHCLKKSGHTHARREAAYRKIVGYGIPDTARPFWHKAMKARQEQRQRVITVESKAFDQTIANYYLDRARTNARHWNVSEAMIKRAVDHGHKRASKQIAEWETERKRREAHRVPPSQRSNVA